MKIVMPPPPTAIKNEKFTNGHIYKCRYSNDFYLFACGHLVSMVVGNEIRNVNKAGSDPATYIDVTDEYTLIHNKLLGDQT